VESKQTHCAGLGFADFITYLGQQKVLTQAQGVITLQGQQAKVSGYEIHAGSSAGAALDKPFLHFTQHPHNFAQDGFISADNCIAGTYLHG
ncbi:hypothetical protein, partial [Chryseobacterium gambrini]|uniref:hypothetical protein n=1 Tax=Chryseobacterium gambrini TaxID=373672 RepID=UPI002A252679|nr:hypothetical protein [Chryseobacterium gambrini]